jgi:hypothetical protein
MNPNLMNERLFQEQKRTFGRISKSPKIGQFEEIMKIEKKKIGPNHYKNVEPGVKMGQDRTGVYNGLSKVGTEMLQMIAHIKTQAKDTPQVGHYHPNHRL